MKLIYGGYGHHPKGRKAYVYWGNNNLRTGQRVVAPVTNKKSGRTYNTLFTIAQTSGADTVRTDKKAQMLSQAGIGIKSIRGLDTLSDLPSGQKYASKAAWERDSDERERDYLRERLLKMEM